MGTPNYPRDLPSEFNKMKRDIRNAFTSSNLRTGMAKIGAKVIEITGELVLNIGATLRAQYDNGVNALYVGPTTVSGRPAGKVGIRRYDGTQALSVFGGQTDKGYFAIYDQGQNIIVSDDSVSGQGLARPWLPYTSLRTGLFTNPAETTTSSSFVPHHTILGFLQHPKINVEIFMNVAPGDTAEVRLRDPDSGEVIDTTGTTDGGFKTLAGNHPNYDFGDSFKYDLEIRRVSGASPVGFSLTRAYGIQS